MIDQVKHVEGLGDGIRINQSRAKKKPSSRPTPTVAGRLLAPYGSQGLLEQYEFAQSIAPSSMETSSGASGSCPPELTLCSISEESLLLIVSHLARDQLRGPKPCFPTDALPLADTSRAMRRVVARTLLPIVTAGPASRYPRVCATHTTSSLLAWLRVGGTTLRDLAIPRCTAREAVTICDTLLRADVPLTRLDVCGLLLGDERDDFYTPECLYELDVPEGELVRSLVSLFCSLRLSLKELCLRLNSRVVVDSVCAAHLINVNSLTVFQVEEGQTLALLRVLFSLNDSYSTLMSPPLPVQSALRELHLAGACLSEKDGDLFLDPAETLASVSPYISRLIVSCNEGEEYVDFEWDWVLAAAMHLKYLTSLELLDGKGDGNDDGVLPQWSVISPLLDRFTHPHFSSLSLTAVDLCDFGAFSIVAFAKEVGSRLLRLDLRRGSSPLGELTDQGIKALSSNCTSLKSLSLDLMCNNEDSFDALVDMRKKLTFLQSFAVTLWGLSLTERLEDLTETIVRALGCGPVLTHLELRNCMLSASQSKRVLRYMGSALEDYILRDFFPCDFITYFRILMYAKRYSKNLRILKLPKYRSADSESAEWTTFERGQLLFAVESLARCAVFLDVETVHTRLLLRTPSETPQVVM